MSLSGPHDVIVIGGGVTGAGVARDLARRGASVLLLEQGDYGGGTSGGSSQMIHGGPRYLEFDWRTTLLSCEDSGHIVRIARHMVHRVVFLLPILPGAVNNIERMETAMEVYDRYQPLKLSHPHVRLTPDEALSIEPGLTPELVGAVSMEEWGVDPHRLTFANVQDSLEHGAHASNHARVVGLLLDGRRVTGARYQTADGAHQEARARVVVNAAGPWVPEVAAMAGLDQRLRPAKGIHIVYDRRISNLAISAEAIDGRDLLCIPHGSFTLLGTTDDDYYGDLDSIEVLSEEVDYLLQAFERVFPRIRDYRPVRSTAAVRPTLFRWRPYEDDLSRGYAITDHAARDGLAGLVTVAGGKLSMYRLMAEETADVVAGKLGLRKACSTTAPLPGSERGTPEVAELAAAHGISELSAARLLVRHGCRAGRVLEDTRAGRLVCRCEALTEAELAHAARCEQVTCLADAFRRVGLASGPCAGALCVERAAEVVGRELGWSVSQRLEAAEGYLRSAWLGRSPVLDRHGWAQEELAIGMRRSLR